MFYTEGYLKNKIRKKLLKFLKNIENNGNGRFLTNGEDLFIENFFKQVSSDKSVVLDIGANAGEYTEMLLNKADSYGKDLEIYSFEPSKSCMEILTKKFKEEVRVELINKGVSEESGTKRLYYDHEKSGMASLHKRELSHLSINMDEFEDIETITLKEFIEENKISHMNLLKIDIEGHELFAFRGAGEYLNSDFIDYIQFEYGGANLDSKTSLLDFYNLFESKGFSVAKIMPKGLLLRNYMPWMENFQFANFVAVSNKIIK